MKSEILIIVIISNTQTILIVPYLNSVRIEPVISIYERACKTQQASFSFML